MVYLKEHLTKYPLMQIEDVLKLFMQGILGPGHLVSSFDNCIQRINAEYHSINRETNDDLVEQISDKYVRIYLYPYYQSKHDFTALVNAFISSSKLPINVEEFKKEIATLKTKENEDYIDRYLESGDFLISHSKVYKEAYDPHYLVISKKFLEEIL